MNTLGKFVSAAVIASILIASSGCASFSAFEKSVVPKAALIKGEKTIYWAEKQSFPNESIVSVMTPPAPAPVSTNLDARSISPEIIAAVVAEMFKIVPQSLDTYKQLRTGIGTLNREFLATGYTNDELAGLATILGQIKQMQGNSLLKNNGK